MISTWGCAEPNSTAVAAFHTLLGEFPRFMYSRSTFRGFQPDQSGLPAGHPIAPMRKVPLLFGIGAPAAAVDAPHAQGLEAPTRQCAQIRHVPTASVRRKRRIRPRI